MHLMMSGHDGEPVVVAEDIDEYDLQKPLAMQAIRRSIEDEIDMQLQLMGKGPVRRCPGCRKKLDSIETIACQGCGAQVLRRTG